MTNNEVKLLVVSNDPTYFNNISQRSCDRGFTVDFAHAGNIDIETVIQRIKIFNPHAFLLILSTPQKQQLLNNHESHVRIASQLEQQGRLVVVSGLPRHNNILSNPRISFSSIERSSDEAASITAEFLQQQWNQRYNGDFARIGGTFLS